MMRLISASAQQQFEFFLATDKLGQSARVQGVEAGVRALLAADGEASVLPEILEPIRRHFGVANRVRDIFMAHIVLEGSRVMPIVGELVTSGVPEHVRMNREWELGSFSGPSDHFQGSGSRGWTASLGDEDISSLHILPM